VMDTNGTSLQKRVATWHVQRFPTLTIVNSALKASEEVGEVCKAVNGQFEALQFRPTGDILEESADVVIALMAMIERFCGGADLLTAVEKKLAECMDPSSGHPIAVEVIA
jgi:NTP pyrophosphatase (non-canonical NTP hydrolase)